MKPTPTPEPSIYYPDWITLCCPATPTPHVLGSRTFADGRITQELMSDGSFVTIMREPNFQTPTPVPTINFHGVQVYSTDDTITYLTTEPSHLVECPKKTDETPLWAFLTLAVMVGLLAVGCLFHLYRTQSTEHRLDALEKKGGEGSDPNS